MCNECGLCVGWNVLLSISILENVLFENSSFGAFVQDRLVRFVWTWSKSD